MMSVYNCCCTCAPPPLPDLDQRSPHHPIVLRNQSPTTHTQRDDISHFLPIYLERKILKADPFVEIDQEVGFTGSSRRRTDRLGCVHRLGQLYPPPPPPHHHHRTTKQGVGQLIRMTIERSKAVKSEGIQYGVCGEQGGEPRSVAFFHKVKIPWIHPFIHPFIQRSVHVAN
jgi:hypothetical protein